MEYGHLHTSSKRSSQVMEWEEQEELKRARRSSGEGNVEKNEVKAGLLCQSRREKMRIISWNCRGLGNGPTV